MIQVGPALASVVAEVPADALSNANSGQDVNARAFGYNGTTWDRLRTSQAGSGSLKVVITDSVGTGIGGVLQWPYNNDAVATGSNNGAAVTAGLVGYNGTTWDRLRTSTVGTGVLQTGTEFSFLNIAAGIATTVVKASAGILHSIVLNSAATATNTTIVYDNPSGVGTVIGRPAVTTATVPTTLLYDLKFANGLTIITATANGGDMTIVYR